jgi:hypothetical protein
MIRKLKLGLVALLLPLIAFASSYPSPTFQNVTVNGTLTTNGTIAGTGTLGIANGGTGATTASAALTNLGGIPIAGGNFTGAAGISLNQNAATRFTISNQSSGTSALTGIDFESFGGGWQVDVPQNATFVNPLIFKFGGTEVARLSPTGAAFQVTGGASFTQRPTFNGATPWDSANLNFATPPAIGATTPSTGKFTTLQATSTITPSSTSGIVGTATNDNANAGSIGEYVTATGSGVALTTSTPANITSVSLTAGDWDVSGNVQYTTSAVTGTAFWASISTVSGTNGGLGALINFQFTSSGLNTFLPTPVVRISVASTTTVYLVGEINFASGTASGSGIIRARRVR